MVRSEPPYRAKTVRTPEGKILEVRQQAMQRSYTHQALMMLREDAKAFLKKDQDRFALEFIREAAKAADMSVMEWLHALEAIKLTRREWPVTYELYDIMAYILVDPDKKKEEEEKVVWDKDGVFPRIDRS